MTRAVYLLLSLLLALGVPACAPTAPATREAPEPYHPLATRTGVETVDQILSAVAAGDVQALPALVEFTAAKCTRLDGLGGPPKCREGEQEGTSMDVLPFLGGEGSYLRREEIGHWPGIDVSGLYAVYEVSPELSVEEYFPAGRYAMLLVNPADRSGMVLRVGERGIVRVDWLFDISPEALNSLIEREAAGILLAPKN